MLTRRARRYMRVAPYALPGSVSNSHLSFAQFCTILLPKLPNQAAQRQLTMQVPYQRKPLAMSCARLEFYHGTAEVPESQDWQE